MTPHFFMWKGSWIVTGCSIWGKRIFLRFPSFKAAARHMKIVYSGEQQPTDVDICDPEEWKPFSKNWWRLKTS